MEPGPELWSGSDWPPGHQPILTVNIHMFEERPGGCAVNFGISDDSPLLTRHGTRGRALAACRDLVVGELDALVEEFADEE
jgi:hypothetical protein